MSEIAKKVENKTIVFKTKEEEKLYAKSKLFSDAVLEMLTEHNNDIIAIEKLFESKEKNKDEFMSRIMYLISRANGERDEYELPKGLNKANHTLGALLDKDFEFKEKVVDQLAYFFEKQDWTFGKRYDTYRKSANLMVNLLPIYFEDQKKELGAKFQKYAREIEKLSKSFIKKKQTKKPGMSPSILKRNKEIRSRVNELNEGGMTYRQAYEFVLKDYPALNSWQSVKSICDYKDGSPLALENK